jgi:hypothetical protein
MNDLDLRTALRTASSLGAAKPNIDAVKHRARVLRTWRAIVGAATAIIAIAAIAWPLHELQHLGEGPTPGGQQQQTVIEFAPLEGWHTQSATAAAEASFSEPTTTATMANVLLPEASAGYSPGLDNGFVEKLPPTGIAMAAQQLLFTRNPIPPGSGYAPASLPLDLSEGSRSTGPWEGLSRTDLLQIHLSVLVEGRPILVNVVFGTDHPDTAMVREAQTALDQLRVTPAQAPTDAIDQFGISMPVPNGWHALLYAGDPTLIVANNPIDSLSWEPTQRGFSPDEVTMMLDESDALVELQGWAPLEGPLTIGDGERCDGCEMLDGGSPPPAGHVLYQRTFTTGGRAFSLYVEFGGVPTAGQLDDVNALLARITIEPLAEQTYTPAPGATRVGPIYDGEDVPEVAASDGNRLLAWGYIGMHVPDGWTGQDYPVAGLEEPMSLLAIGSWNFTPGGYCGPINALRELPADGALVWVDGYGANPPTDLRFLPKPQSVDVTTAPTDPSPCFGGADPHVFRWWIDGRSYVVHVALGGDASAATIAQTQEAVASIEGR